MQQKLLEDTSTTREKFVDIERWRPTRWDDYVANEELKEYLLDFVWNVRREGRTSGMNGLITGDSRTGKTAGIHLAIQALACLNLDFGTLDPCGTCTHCATKVDRFGNSGWEHIGDWIAEGLVTPTDNNFTMISTPASFLYIPVNCGSVTERELDDIIRKVRQDDTNLRVVYLDEVHRLVRRSLDERLLISMEDCPAIWIASSAHIRKRDQFRASDETILEKGFQNRFTYRIETERPTVPELAVWLGTRCHQWGVQCDAKGTLTLLAERSNQVPGMALHVINKAYQKRTKLLTKELVEMHIFDFDD